MSEQSQYHDTTVEVLVEEGRNPGKPVASYKPGKRSSYLVFPPKNAPIGKYVRVVLKQREFPDQRGEPLFDGVPAPDELSERWKDNDNGTISRVGIAKNWLGVERETGVKETRPVTIQNGYATIQSNFNIVWGNDVASSTLEDLQVKITPINQETVGNGQVTWEKINERQELQPVVNYAIVRIDETGGSDVHTNRFATAYLPDWKVGIKLVYLNNTSEQAQYFYNLTWKQMPTWWQQEYQARYPVCSCGRSRRDTQVADGYGKCEQCRADDTCIRCGKKTKVTNLNGRLVCDSCKPYEQQDQLVTGLVPQVKRDEFAATAQLLLTGESLPRETGEMILAATLGHMESDYQRQRLLGEWKGYGFYYFTDQGVYGTKFSPAALQFLQYLPQANGNQLIELIAWLTGYQKVELCEQYGDFYHRTQIKGEQRSPALTQDSLSKLIMAVRLRGSEADRIAVLAAYEALVKKLGKDSPLAKAVAEILQNNEQDYAAASSKMREFDNLLAKAEKGHILLNWGGHFRRMGDNDQSDLWVIDPDGQEVNPTDASYRRYYTSEGDKTWPIVSQDQLALRWNRGQGGRQFMEYWEVVKLPMSGLTKAQEQAAIALEPHERFRGQGTGWDFSCVGTVTVSVSRDQLERPTRRHEGSSQPTTEQVSCEVNGWSEEVLGEAGYQAALNNSGWSLPYLPKNLKAIRDAEAEQEVATHESAMLVQQQEKSAAAYQQAEEEFVLRDSAIAVGTVFDVVDGFTWGTAPDSKKRLQWGPIWDDLSNKRIMLVIDPFHKASESVKPGKRVLVKVRARSGSQLHLFEEFQKLAGLGRVRVVGYFVQVVMNPKDFDPLIKEADAKIVATNKKLGQLGQQKSIPAQTLPAPLVDDQARRRTVAEKLQTWSVIGDTEDESPIAAALRKAMGKK